jgi:hypothetical protein
LRKYQRSFETFHVTQAAEFSPKIPGENCFQTAGNQPVQCVIGFMLCKAGTIEMRHDSAIS